MKISLGYLSLLCLGCTGAYAARIDLTSHSAGLAEALVRLIPIESRYIDEDGKTEELHVRGDHEVFVKYPLARAELVALRDFLEGQALGGEVYLNARGTILIRDTAGRILDLREESVLNGNAFREKAISRHLEPEVASSAGDRSRSTSDQVALFEAAEHAVHTMMRAMSLGIYPGDPVAKSETSSTALPSRELILPHQIAADPNLNPLDLAFESEARIGRVAAAAGDVPSLIIEIDDSRLNSPDRAEYRHALNFLRLRGFGPWEELTELIRLRYLFSLEHNCVADLER